MTTMANLTAPRHPFASLAALFASTSSSSRRPRALSDLKDDNSGAIMMTGLFMSCFLIGSLWFVIGIGDTIVFRDRMQEAADHGAFASAALHAKGMNFISLCNLVLLAAVTIHIILGIIHDIALAICILSVGFGCGFWLGARRAYTGYFKILKPAAKAIHLGEEVAAKGYPAMGLIEGIQVGRTYGGGRGTSEVTVLPLSASLIPGGGKEGLPVNTQPMNYLCKKIVNVGFDLIFNQALGISGKSPSGRVLNKVKSIIGSVVEFRYCNDLGSGSGIIGGAGVDGALGEGNGKVDEENKKIEEENKNRPKDTPPKETHKPADRGGGGGGGGLDPGFDSFWGTGGPMTVIPKASNGDGYFQTYAINVAPSMQDESESRVGIGRGTKNGMQKYTKTERALGYFAQAEFYFDCDATWTADGCNKEDNATFQIKWRARLKKFSIGATGDKVLNLGLTVLANVGKLDQIRDTVGSLGGRAGDILNGGGVTGISDLRQAFDAFKPDNIKSEVGDVSKAFSITPGGMYH